MMVTLNDAYLADLAGEEDDGPRRSKFLERMRGDIANGQVKARGLPWRARSERGLRLTAYEPEAIPPAALQANVMAFAVVAKPDDVSRIMWHMRHPSLGPQSGEVVGVINLTFWPQHKIPVEPPPPERRESSLRDRMAARRPARWEWEPDEIGGWVFVEVDIETHSAARAEQPSDDSVLQYIREIVAKNGGYIAQETGAAIVRDKFPHIGRDRARQLVKGVTGNEKRGPRGPRNNSAK